MEALHIPPASSAPQGPLTGTAGLATTPPRPGCPVTQPAGTTLPLAPPTSPTSSGTPTALTGYFDYRPKDADEEIVRRHLDRQRVTWTYDSKALEQNPGYCPTGDTLTTARATRT